METAVQHNSDQTITKIKDFSDAALQAVTSEMVTEMASKLVKTVEFADDVLQPETLELLRILPEVSKSLERTLIEVKKLEEKGTLTTLFQLVEMVQSMKSALTGQMVTDLMEKAIRGIEIADGLLQKGSLELVERMVDAFEDAKVERQNQEPLTTLQLVRALTGKETREGLSLLVAFLKRLPT